MSKHILIASHGLQIGGAESSLIGYLHALAEKNAVQTDLFLYRHDGELMKYIPGKVKLLPEKAPYSCLATPIKNVIKKGHFLIAWGRLRGKRKAFKYIKAHPYGAEKSAVGLEYSHKYTKAFMPKISDTVYDLAVSFLTPHYFVAEKVKAKKKVAFIHTDYSYISIDKDSEYNMWNAYDVIAAVSDAVMKGFIGLFPALKHKVRVIENINPEELIKARAEEFVPKNEMPEDGSTTILSIGRFCDAKNFESIPYKMRLLKDHGIDAKWYIIGYGDDSLIRKAVRETDTTDSVIMLGKKTNPYPYIKRCHIYAQPSRYEGKAVTVLEAQMLGKPVIISNYATASSQLKDGVDGIIAPMDDKGFAETLISLISDEGKRQKLGMNCQNSNYSNATMVDMLLSLA